MDVQTVQGAAETCGLSVPPPVCVCRQSGGGEEHQGKSRDLISSSSRSCQIEQEVVQVAVYGVPPWNLLHVDTVHAHRHALPVLLSDGLSLEHEGQLGNGEQCADSTTRILLRAKICGQICLWLTTASTCFQLHDPPRASGTFLGTSLKRTKQVF